MTDSVVNPFSVEMAKQHPVVQPAATWSSTDALLGELLREVLELRQQITALQDKLADLADALRHGTPR